MISIFRIILLTLSLLLSFGTSAAPTQYELRVDGLACPFCAYGIEKKLNATDGVEEIFIDINAGTVTVTMAESASMSEDAARQIVKDAGFTLADFKKLSAASDNSSQ
jgi:copper chaperone CopZ